MIQGTTKVYGVIGAPIEHSLSPVMHNFYSSKTGADTAYVPFFVSPENLADAVKGAYALDIQGLNVTVPHKQQIIPFLKDLDQSAKAIGAVNTLVRVPGGYKGYNTDAEGLLRAMQIEQVEIKDCPCIILGAGGAAKAVAYLLVREGAKVVYVVNRKLEKAVQLCQELNTLLDKQVLLPIALADYLSIPQNSYLVVQATNVGMYPNNQDILIDDVKFYQMVHTGIDIIYTPTMTSFMKAVSAAGGKVVNGLTMLLYQGIEAFQLWNPEIDLDSETITEAMQLMLKQLKR